MIATAAMIAAAIAATTVEATTTAAVEAATTTASVEPTAAASATVTAAVLGKGGHGGANECERSETCEKSLQQGGFPHINNLYRPAVLLPREGKPPFTNY
jgi:hypothetical protein